jgi:predicted nucleotidyltransferase
MKKYSLALEKTFSHYPEIKLVYFFGSKAKNKGSGLSDYELCCLF